MLADHVKEQLVILLRQKNWSLEDKSRMQVYVTDTDAPELRSLMQEYFNAPPDDLPQPDKKLHDRMLKEIHNVLVPPPPKISLLTRIRNWFSRKDPRDTIVRGEEGVQEKNPGG